MVVCSTHYKMPANKIKPHDVRLKDAKILKSTLVKHMIAMTDTRNVTRFVKMVIVSGWFFFMLLTAT